MLQTHFGSPIGREILEQVSAFGFRLCRCDAQGRSVEEMLAMVDEVLSAGLIPYVTVDSHNQIRALPQGAYCEWKNEPDIALGRPVIPADVYADEFMAAAEAAAESPVQTIGGPVVSNLNLRGTTYILKFLESCGGSMPDNSFGVAHRYGDGTFSRPHRLNRWQLPFGPFRSRAEEYRWFKAVIGERPWGISELGYPSFEGLTEEDQADHIAREFQLGINEGATFIGVYQINDGPVWNFREHHYGIRRCDEFGVLGDWKPAAYVAPKES